MLIWKWPRRHYLPVHSFNYLDSIVGVLFHSYRVFETSSNNRLIVMSCDSTNAGKNMSHHYTGLFWMSVANNIHLLWGWVSKGCPRHTLSSPRFLLLLAGHGDNSLRWDSIPPDYSRCPSSAPARAQDLTGVSPRVSPGERTESSKRASNPPPDRPASSGRCHGWRAGPFWRLAGQTGTTRTGPPP